PHHDGLRVAEPGGRRPRPLRRGAARAGSVQPRPSAVTAPVARPGLLRSTATITAWNAVSRATGFVRVLAVGAALGTTFLGNTYQSSNLVSNLLFEVLAAGLLSAPLVPAFVALLDAGRRDDAERLAGNLLGLALAALAVLVVVLALGSGV